MQTLPSTQGPIRKYASVVLIACAIATSSLIGFGGNAAAQDPTVHVATSHHGTALQFRASAPVRSSRSSYLHWRTGFVAP
jgi:hypothetical protein